MHDREKNIRLVPAISKEILIFLICFVGFLQAWPMLWVVST